MAIDSEDKRRAVTGLPWMPIYPTADGTIDQADRIQATGYYAPGVVGAPPATARPGNLLLIKVGK